MIWKRRNKWVDRHSKFGLFERKDLILLFQSRYRLYPRKLKLRWTGPYWIIQKFYDGTFLLGTLSGEWFAKPINGYRLRPYHGPMPPYAFHDEETPAINVMQIGVIEWTVP